MRRGEDPLTTLTVEQQVSFFCVRGGALAAGGAFCRACGAWTTSWREGLAANQASRWMVNLLGPKIASHLVRVTDDEVIRVRAPHFHWPHSVAATM